MQLLLILQLIALLCSITLSECHLEDEHLIGVSRTHMQKWTSVISDNSVLRVLPVDKTKKSGPNVIPKHPDSDFTKLAIAKDQESPLKNCFYDTMERKKKFGDIDELLKTAAGCLLKSAGKTGLRDFTLLGTIPGKMTDRHFEKYHADATFGTEERDEVSVNYKPMSDSNDVTVHFDNKLINETMTGKLTYTRGTQYGLVSSKTTSKSHVSSGSLRVICKATYDEDTTTSETATNETTTDEKTFRDVSVVLSPKEKYDLMIQPLTRLETLKVVQPVVLSGYMGVVTTGGEKFFISLTEIPKYFPDFFRPGSEDDIKFLITDFQTVSSFYFLAK